MLYANEVLTTSGAAGHLGVGHATQNNPGDDGGEQDEAVHKCHSAGAGYPADRPLLPVSVLHDGDFRFLTQCRRLVEVSLTRLVLMLAQIEW